MQSDIDDASDSLERQNRSARLQESQEGILTSGDVSIDAMRGRLNTIESHRKEFRSNMREILRQNEAPHGGIVPSFGFYKHMWHWDTAFIAEGMAHQDWEKAAHQFDILFSGQWRRQRTEDLPEQNMDPDTYAGFVPGALFLDKPGYYPGPAHWETQDISGLPFGNRTAGMTQAPILSSSVLCVAREAPSKKEQREFLEKNYNRLKAWHQWLKRNREVQLEGKRGLLAIVHPWESGTDNSPQFDAVLEEGLPLDTIPADVKERVDRDRLDNKTLGEAERPKHEFYYRAMHLVYLYNGMRYNYDRIREESPFIVQEVLYNSLWCQANQDLAEIAKVLGKHEDEQLFSSWAEETRETMNTELWSEERGMYYSSDVRNYDVAGGPRRLEVDTINSLIPLFAGIPDPDQAEKMLEHLFSEDEFWTEYPLATTSQKEEAFEQRYWRGKMWVNTNYLIIKGLDRYSMSLRERNPALAEKCRAKAQELKKKTLKAVSEQGSRESYDSATGKGGTLEDFSWSAALSLALSRKKTA